MNQTRDTDFVIAASVNVLTMRALAAGFGIPGWVGAMVAAGAMAVAGDSQVDPQVQKIAGLIAAPGAVAVQLLTDRDLLQNNSDCCEPCKNGKACK